MTTTVSCYSVSDKKGCIKCGIDCPPNCHSLSTRNELIPSLEPPIQPESKMDSTIDVIGVKVALGPIVQLAESAGKAIMKIYDEPTEDWGVQSKSDDSPLTKADLSANAVICAELEKMESAFPIMSEENKKEDFAVRSKWTAYWCVDPLDGTKEFIKRNGEFTVNIALMAAVDPEAPEAGAKPVLGVVHAPVLKKTYFAAKGVGAFLAEDSGEPKAIKCMEFSESDEGLVLVCSRSHLDERTQAFLDTFVNAKTKSMGSSLKFMLVAAGEAHVYPRMAPTMEWDTAASQIVVEEAGGEVLQCESKKPVRYNKEDLLNPFFYVYGTRQK